MGHMLPNQMLRDQMQLTTWSNATNQMLRGQMQP